jgi:hypothetical protein
MDKLLPLAVAFAGSSGSRSSSSSSCLLGSGLFLMQQARFAYLSVELVSSKSASQEEMHEMSTVSALPPRLSCSSRVSLESLQAATAQRKTEMITQE